MTRETDFLTIGSGIAGLLFSLKAAELGRVLLVTKSDLGESNSRYAQGGVAAVWDREDSLEEHVSDTLIAGAGLCDRRAVEHVVRRGPERIRELIELGVAFTREGDEYELAREGGHGKRRILHAKDSTGREIIRALTQAVREHPRIEILERCMAVDLVTSGSLARRECDLPPEQDEILGAYLLHLDSEEVEAVSAGVVALCSGGAGKVYRYTSNPDIATGDGVAMAWRAGASVANMELVQFHPTCLYHPQAHNFLISEALRGEGGVLRVQSGERFMGRYDERLELAPRDIVARAIDAELKRRGESCVFLDMTHLDREFLQQRFPAIDQRCRDLGLDMSSEPLPVVPAAHYFCGGVSTNLDAESEIRNLFVIGESACTGLHGANRLASNSLLEAAVFAHDAVQACRDRERPAPRPIPPWDSGHAVDSDEQVVIHQTWQEIRRLMWNYVGIVRTSRRLRRARSRIELIQEEIQDYYWDFKITGDLVELRNLATVAELVIRSALTRRESRGLHYTLDYPKPDPRWLRSTRLQRRS